MLGQENNYWQENLDNQMIPGDFFCQRTAHWMILNLLCVSSFMIANSVGAQTPGARFTTDLVQKYWIVTSGSTCGRLVSAPSCSQPNYVLQRSSLNQVEQDRPENDWPKARKRRRGWKRWEENQVCRCGSVRGWASGNRLCLSWMLRLIYIVFLRCAMIG